MTTFSSALALFTMVSVAHPQATNDEIEYVFAGMLQERDKLRSGSYEIEGVQRSWGKFKATVLFKDNKLRFTKEVFGQKETWHASDDGDIVAMWSTQNQNVRLQRSVKGRPVLYYWDPRLAGFSTPDQPDYKRVIALWHDTWVKALPEPTIRKEGRLRIMQRTQPTEFFDTLTVFKVDCDNGFTPVEFTSDLKFKEKSKFPGKVERGTTVVAKWEKVDDVWVPVHHCLSLKDDRVIEEFRLKWDWVNRDVSDKEFAAAALNAPPGARIIDFRNATKEDPGAEELKSLDELTPVSMMWRFSLFAALVLAVIFVLWRWQLRPRSA